jgi:hypothetical protein
MTDLSKRWRSVSPLCTSKRTRTESPVSPDRVPVEFSSFLPLKGTTTTNQGKRRFTSFKFLDLKRLMKAVFLFLFLSLFYYFSLLFHYNFLFSFTIFIILIF